jgi:hypothetical protein
LRVFSTNTLALLLTEIEDDIYHKKPYSHQ